MNAGSVPSGRRERAKEEKRRRILGAARSLFAKHGVGGVTTQQIADRADVAVGTLFLYAATKAELLIMVQNRKFEEAIDQGSATSRSIDSRAGTEDALLALIEPVIACIREHPENGRQYLHELAFGDATETHRREGILLGYRLESEVVHILADRAGCARKEAETLARVVSSIIHMTTTSTIHLGETTSEILDAIRRQLAVILPSTSTAPAVSAESGGA